MKARRRLCQPRPLFPGSIERDSLGFLCHVNVFEMRSVQIVRLLFRVQSELGQIGWNDLLGFSENVGQLRRPRLVVSGEEGMRHARLSRSTRTSNTMNVVLDRERKGIVDHDLNVGNIKSTRSNVRGN